VPAAVDGKNADGRRPRKAGERLALRGAFHSSGGSADKPRNRPRKVFRNIAEDQVDGWADVQDDPIGVGEHDNVEAFLDERPKSGIADTCARPEGMNRSRRYSRTKMRQSRLDNDLVTTLVTPHNKKLLGRWGFGRGEKSGSPCGIS